MLVYLCNGFFNPLIKPFDVTGTHRGMVLFWTPLLLLTKLKLKYIFSQLHSLVDFIYSLQKLQHQSSFFLCRIIQNL